MDLFEVANDTNFKSKMGNFKKNPNRCLLVELNHEAEGGYFFLEKSP